jgi:hypothetical protein
MKKHRPAISSRRRKSSHSGPDFAFYAYMVVRRRKNLILTGLLSILLTFVSQFPATAAWGIESNGVDRRATVRAAYEAFHNVILFLSGSDSFLAQLSQEEHRHFWRLGGMIIPNQTLFSAPTFVQVRGQTSHQVKQKLYFSSDSSSFIIPPDKTVRMANGW